MDLYALGLVLGAVFVLLGLFAWAMLSAHGLGKDAAAGDLRAAAAELREERVARARADALAEERRLRLVALEARGAEWSARASADAAAVGAIDAALPARPGGPVDLGAALDGLLPSTAAGAGHADRGAAAPAPAGPGPPPPVRG